MRYEWQVCDGGRWVSMWDRSHDSLYSALAAFTPTAEQVADCLLPAEEARRDQFRLVHIKVESRVIASWLLT
jgi:hypothetical protein